MTKTLKNVRYELLGNWLDFSEIPALPGETKRFYRNEKCEAIYGIFGDVTPGQSVSVAIPCDRMLTVVGGEKLPAPSVMGVLVVDGKRYVRNFFFTFDGE